MKLRSESDRVRRNRERGTTMLLIAASMFVLVGIAAIALDLGGLRFDIRTDQLATDAAATAGVASINPFAGSEADLACSVAWDYLLLNLEDEGPVTVPPNCTVFAGTCDPAVTRQTTATADPYSVTITHPVLDSDPLMSGQDINANIDGTPCQRLGVELTRTRDYAFGAVLGADEGDTTVSTVARIGAGTGAGEVVPLLVLEPVACNALYTSGQGAVTVSYYEDSPGFIVVDSNGSTCGPSNPYTIDAKGTTQGWIRAVPVPAPKNIPSAILSYALSGIAPGDPNASYDPNDLVTPSTPCDVTDPPESCYRLYPEPMPVSRRITRAPIDWRYNCQTSYADYLGIVEILPCPDAPAPHIDILVSALTSGPPPGYTRWLSNPSHTCSPGSMTVPAGDWWIDCDPFIVNGSDVVFEQGDIVFDGDVDLRSDGTLTVNANAASDPMVPDATVFIRSGGDLKKGAQSGIALHHTFVLLEDGVVDLVGGDGGLVWTAPLTGDFEDLALWSESSAQHELGGQSGNSLTGTFFTPLADPFLLTGQSGQFQTSAQFLTRRLEVGGQGEVRMEPNPDRQTLIPIREVRLVR